MFLSFLREKLKSATYVKTVRSWCLTTFLQKEKFLLLCKIQCYVLLTDSFGDGFWRSHSYEDEAKLSHLHKNRIVRRHRYGTTKVTWLRSQLGQLVILKGTFFPSSLRVGRQRNYAAQILLFFFFFFSIISKYIH